MLCEPGQALGTAKELAGRIEANAPLAVRESRSVVRAAMTEDEATGWRLSGEALAAPWAARTRRRG